MGRHCIEELVKEEPLRVVEVYTCQKNSNDPLLNKLSETKISVKSVSKKELTNLVSSESHQSFVAAVKPKPFIHIQDFIDEAENKTHSLVLMIDSIFDPHNLGAILRAAECFGVDLVIYSKNRGSDVTPTVSKTSAGASELVPIAPVSNLSETMKAFQKGGFWAISADVGPQAENLYTFKFPEKSLIVMGSEGEGVQPLLLKTCDFYISIPMRGKIDSLNVSQATAVILNGYRQFYLTS